MGAASLHRASTTLAKVAHEDSAAHSVGETQRLLHLLRFGTLSMSEMENLTEGLASNSVQHFGLGVPN